MNCLGCGKDFIPKRINHIACSPPCGVKAQNIKRSAAKKEWAALNADKMMASKQKWLENNPEKRKEASASYMKRNRPYYAQYSSLRSRHMKKAQPIWANIEEILDAYIEAEYFQMEVDHIIPIKHGLVCGLHVRENLQLLTRSENAKKNNMFVSYDEDIVGIIK